MGGFFFFREAMVWDINIYIYSNYADLFSFGVEQKGKGTQGKLISKHPKIPHIRVCFVLSSLFLFSFSGPR